MGKKYFKVGVEMPEGASTASMREYIKDAVGAWKGSFRMEDPLRHIEYDKVTVKSIKEPSQKKPNPNISAISCDSYVDPMGQLQDGYPEAFKGNVPIYMIKHPFDEIIFVSFEPFTLEEALANDVRFTESSNE